MRFQSCMDDNPYNKVPMYKFTIISCQLLLHYFRIFLSNLASYARFQVAPTNFALAFMQSYRLKLENEFMTLYLYID